MTHPSSPQDRQSWIRWVVVAVAVIVVGSVAWYVWGYFETKGAIHAMKDEVGTAPTTHGRENPLVNSGTDYSKIDVESLTVDQFYNDAIYPQEYRIKWANEIIKERGQELHDDLSSILVQHGYPALGPLVTPDLNNTGREILVQHDVVNYMASVDSNLTEGKKLLAASSDYELSEKVFATSGKGPAVAFHLVPQNSQTGSYMESPVFSHAAVGNYSPNGVPSKILVYTNGVTGESSESIERFVGGRWVTYRVMGTNDPGLITNPQQIADK